MHFKNNSRIYLCSFLVYLMIYKTSFFCHISSSDTKTCPACLCFYDADINPSYNCVSGLCKKIYFLRPGFPIPSNSSRIPKDDVWETIELKPHKNKWCGWVNVVFSTNNPISRITTEWTERTTQKNFR